jgi:putative endonuclease
MEHRYFVYVLTNRHHTALYVGVTNDLVRRVHEHRTKIASGFTTRYNVDKLVYFEETSDVVAAIAREKQIKGGSREKKIALVNAMNPDWRDLFDDLI